MTHEDDPFYIDPAKNFPGEAVPGEDEPIILDAQLLEDPDAGEHAEEIQHVLGAEIAELTAQVAQAVGGAERAATDEGRRQLEKYTRRLKAHVATTTAAIALWLSVMGGAKPAQAGEVVRVLGSLGADAAWQAQAEMDASKFEDVNDANQLESQIPVWERLIESLESEQEQVVLEISVLDKRIEAAETAGHTDEAQKLQADREPMADMFGALSKRIKGVRTTIENAEKRIKELRSTKRKVLKSLGGSALRGAAGALGKLGW